MSSIIADIVYWTYQQKQLPKRKKLTIQKSEDKIITISQWYNCYIIHWKSKEDQLKNYYEQQGNKTLIKMTHILGQDLPCSLKHLKKLEKNIWNSGQLKDKDPWKAGNSRSFSEESTCSAGDPSSIPGSGRSAGERIDYALQYSWASLVASW